MDTMKILNMYFKIITILSLDILMIRIGWTIETCELMRVPFKKYIDENPDSILVLDGGQGTELENRGIDISSPLWSTVSFISDSFWDTQVENKERTCIREMFADFEAAGANILSTITYQTSYLSVSENTQIKTVEEYKILLTKIIAFCRSCIENNDTYLLGAVGPYAARIGAEYTGDYGQSADKIDFLEYFGPQLEVFNNDDNIDIIGFETIPNRQELEAILSFNESIITKPFFISLSLNDEGGLRDGTSFTEIGDIFLKYKGRNGNLIYTGANCISYSHSTNNISSLSSAVPHLNLIIYPNSGEIYNQQTKTWSNGTCSTVNWDQTVNDYINNGVKIVGGCCRTTPKDIRQIKMAVDSLKAA